MTRAEFYETVTVPLGPGGSMIPVAGISATPYSINFDGSVGEQAVAYDARVGISLASSMITDATGTVSFWLEMGDYDVVFADTHAAPRINSFTRGFCAASLDPASLIDAAQDTLFFSGDLKFSLQLVDHGEREDGTFEWLLITGGPDLNGRLVAQADYPNLWKFLNEPTIDSGGNFRLPNLCGRCMIAAGQSIGLQIYNTGDTGGEEMHVLQPNEESLHTHVIDNNVTGIANTDNAQASISVDEAFPLPAGHQSCVTAHPMDATHVIASASAAGGGDDWVPRITPYKDASTIDWGGSTHQHSHTNTDSGHQHGVADPGHNHTCEPPPSGGQGHNNLQPWAGMSLFIKS